MGGIIAPRVLKGFRDSLPAGEMTRRRLIRALEDHFASYGYVPIDTPALEYAEVLLSKGGGENDKQTYRFTDHGGRDVALRFDLTVPFARYAAAHRGDLAMPFRRYHIAKVWRGENTQRGRYREFMQCDFDIVGSEGAPADMEIMLMMAEGLEALGAGESRIRFSHRGLFNGLLGNLGLEGMNVEVLRAVDKMGRIGREETGRLLGETAGDERAEALLDFITPEGDNRRTLEKMGRLAGGGSDEARVRVLEILDAAEELGMGDDLVLDPSITRGLDYYTGIVFETFLNDLPALGSVCSGGRYDNLTGLFMKDAVSGVGASIGLDRLITGLEEVGSLDSRPRTADVLILMLDECLTARYQAYARDLRRAGLRVMVYPDARKLGVQFRFAESGGIPLALIAGEREAASGRVNLKDLRTRESFNDMDFEAAREKALAVLEDSFGDSRNRG